MREVNAMSEPADAAAEQVAEHVPADHSIPPKHPAEVALFGFIAGVIDVLVVPGVLVTTIQNFWKHAQFNILTLGIATLVLPMALLVSPRTRRFGEAMVLGGAVTAFAVASVVLVLKALVNS
jgi:hypothetical protein